MHRFTLIPFALLHALVTSIGQHNGLTIVIASGRRACLSQRLRFGKRVKCVTVSHDPINGRNVGNGDFKNPRHDNDTGQADVGDRRRIAVTELSCFRIAGKPLFEGLQTGREPVNLPGTP